MKILKSDKISGSNGLSGSSIAVGLVIRKEHPEALQLAKDVAQWCAGNGIEFAIGIDPDRSVSIPEATTKSLAELAQSSSIVCSLGGDGTLISAARHSGSNSPLFIGVHFGTLGFLTEITPKDLINVLNLVTSNKAEESCSVSSRSLFSVTVIRDSKPVLQTQSLNDVVIQKSARSRLIEVDVHAGEQPVMRLRSDGLIVSTPTGSTAYSMAAGGPIVEPSLAAMTITPICPHSLTSRPLVLGTDSELIISLPDTSGQVFAIIDGVETIELESGDTVMVTEAPNRARFFRRKETSYFESLRRKLHWNAPNDPGF